MISNKKAIVAPFLGALLLQVAKARAITESDQSYDYNPMNLAQDLTWPEDSCCRLYRNWQFRSRPEADWPEGEYDWQDLCTSAEELEKVIDLSDEEYVHLGLNNQVQSYKCGSNTSIKFCKNANQFKCDQYEYGESGAGGSESQDIGLHDQHSTVILKHYNPGLQHAATIYSMDKCHGHQSVIWTEEGQKDSGDMYADIHSSLATTPDLPGWFTDPGVKSVLLPKGAGYWVRTYEDINFGGLEMYGESSNDNWTHCVSFDSFDGSQVSSLKWGKMIIDETSVAPNCCRLYHQSGFKLKEADEGFVDKCLVWANDDNFDLEEDQPAMCQVQSYRCGDGVISFFDDGDQMNRASAGATNPDVSFSSAMGLILESSNNYYRTATVYSGRGCSGDSWSLLAEGDDPVVFDADKLIVGQNILSVFIQPGSDAQIELLPTNGNYEDVETLPMSATDGGEAGGETQACFDISDDNAGRISRLRLIARQ